MHSLDPTKQPPVISHFRLPDILACITAVLDFFPSSRGNQLESRKNLMWPLDVKTWGGNSRGCKHDILTQNQRRLAAMANALSKVFCELLHLLGAAYSSGVHLTEIFFINKPYLGHRTERSLASGLSPVYPRILSYLKGWIGWMSFTLRLSLQLTWWLSQKLGISGRPLSLNTLSFILSTQGCSRTLEPNGGS